LEPERNCDQEFEKWTKSMGRGERDKKVEA